MFDSQYQSKGTAYANGVALLAVAGNSAICATGMPCVSVSVHRRHIQKDSGRQKDEQRVAIHCSAFEAESK